MAPQKLYPNIFNYCKYLLEMVNKVFYCIRTSKKGTPWNSSNDFYELLIFAFFQKGDVMNIFVAFSVCTDFLNSHLSTLLTN